MSHDMEQLKAEISDISRSHLDTWNIDELARNLKNKLSALNPLDWVQYIILLVIIFGIVLLVIIVFPLIFRVLLRSVATTRLDILELCLKKKKKKKKRGENVKTTPEEKKTKKPKKQGRGEGGEEGGRWVSM